MASPWMQGGSGQFMQIPGFADLDDGQKRYAMMMLQGNVPPEKAVEAAKKGDAKQVMQFLPQHPLMGTGLPGFSLPAMGGLPAGGVMQGSFQTPFYGSFPGSMMVPQQIMGGVNGGINGSFPPQHQQHAPSQQPHHLQHNRQQQMPLQPQVQQHQLHHQQQHSAHAQQQHPQQPQTNRQQQPPAAAAAAAASQQPQQTALPPPPQQQQQQQVRQPQPQQQQQQPQQHQRTAQEEKSSSPDDQWVSYTDPSTGKAYYHNPVTQKKQWEKPPGFVDKTEEKCDWQSYTDPRSGKAFYHNSATGAKTWERPPEYEAYIQRKAEKQQKKEKEEKEKAEQEKQVQQMYAAAAEKEKERQKEERQKEQQLQMQEKERQAQQQETEAKFLAWGQQHKSSEVRATAPAAATTATTTTTAPAVPTQQQQPHKYSDCDEGAWDRARGHKGEVSSNQGTPVTEGRRPEGGFNVGSLLKAEEASGKHSISASGPKEETKIVQELLRMGKEREAARGKTGAADLIDIDKQISRDDARREQRERYHREHDAGGWHGEEDQQGYKARRFGTREDQQHAWAETTHEARMDERNRARESERREWLERNKKQHHQQQQPQRQGSPPEERIVVKNKAAPASEATRVVGVKPMEKTVGATVRLLRNFGARGTKGDLGTIVYAHGNLFDITLKGSETLLREVRAVNFELVDHDADKKVVLRPAAEHTPTPHHPPPQERQQPQHQQHPRIKEKLAAGCRVITQRGEAAKVKMVENSDRVQVALDENGKTFFTNPSTLTVVSSDRKVKVTPSASASAAPTTKVKVKSVQSSAPPAVGGKGRRV